MHYFTSLCILFVFSWSINSVLQLKKIEDIVLQDSIFRSNSTVLINSITLEPKSELYYLAFNFLLWFRVNRFFCCWSLWHFRILYPEVNSFNSISIKSIKLYPEKLWFTLPWSKIFYHWLVQTHHFCTLFWNKMTWVFSHDFDLITYYTVNLRNNVLNYPLVF